MKRDDLIDAPERRGVAASGFEVRDDGTSLTLEGYASVFEHPYDVYGGPPVGWSETIARDAMDKTLAERPDLHLLVNHEGLPLARTKSGTLDLTADDHGLKVVAHLDLSDPDVQRLAPKMRRGDMDEMSFAFRVKAQQWSQDETERRITELSLHKGDVSVVNFGANPATTAQIRKFVEAIAQGDDAMLAEVRSMMPSAVRLASTRLAAVAESRGVRPKGRLAAALDVLAERDLAG